MLCTGKLGATIQSPPVRKSGPDKILETPPVRHVKHALEVLEQGILYSKKKKKNPSPRPLQKGTKY